MNENDNNDEDIPTKLDNGMDFNDLTSRQIGTLRSIDVGRFNYAEASEKMIDMLETLQVIGLVDRTQRLTPSGSQAIVLAELLGGSRERRMVVARKDVEVDEDDLYHDDYVHNEEEDIRFVNAYKANRFGTLT